MDLLAIQLGRARVPGYVLAFAAWLALLAVLFHALRSYLVGFFMMPLAGVAEAALSMLGMPASLGDPYASAGFVLLSIGSIVYRVTFECTGIFALLLCSASILAFPVPLTKRLQGLLMAGPAFVAYSALRLIIMGVVAYLSPEHIDLFHLYVMVVANVGFVLALWLYWLRTTVDAEAS
jgi:exosortase/archaeosortase family protein